MQTQNKPYPHHFLVAKTSCILVSIQSQLGKSLVKPILVSKLIYISAGDGEVVEQVISQQPAENEDPQVRRSVLDDAIRQLQEQQDQQAGRQHGTPRRGAYCKFSKPFE